MQNQIVQTGVSAVVGEIGLASEPALVNDSSFEAFEVRWLPSIPLLNKRNAPQAAGVGILYSEDLDQVFHVFETDNLCNSINSCNRQQTNALAQDPNCRLSWYETAERLERRQVMDLLTARSGLAATNRQESAR